MFKYNLYCSLDQTIYVTFYFTNNHFNKFLDFRVRKYVFQFLYEDKGTLQSVDHISLNEGGHGKNNKTMSRKSDNCFLPLYLSPKFTKLYLFWQSYTKLTQFYLHTVWCWVKQNCFISFLLVLLATLQDKQRVG